MRLIDADKLPEHKFTIESAKGSDYMRGWNDAIDAIVDNEPTVITNSVYEAYCALLDEEFEHSDSFWITTPKGKKINFVKERPQGEWINDSDDLPVCKECGEVALQRVCVKVPQLIQTVHMVRSNFCPNCGADMRGGRE
jgi:hypothetical protein